MDKCRPARDESGREKRRRESVADPELLSWVFLDGVWLGTMGVEVAERTRRRRLHPGSSQKMSNTHSDE
jgi:hypothetical protein